MFSRLRRTLRYYYLRFQRLKGNPHAIARGIALGTFIGVTPTMPLHTILIVALSWPLKSNLLAAILAAAVVSNPLTFFAQYYFAWKVGQFITQSTLSWDQIEAVMGILRSGAGLKESMSAIYELGSEAITSLVVGGCILATPLAVGGYLLSLRFFTALRRKRMEKHVLN